MDIGMLNKQLNFKQLMKAEQILLKVTSEEDTKYPNMDLKTLIRLLTGEPRDPMELILQGEFKSSMLDFEIIALEEALLSLSNIRKAIDAQVEIIDNLIKMIK